MCPSYGMDTQDREPGEAFTAKSGKEAEMEKLMRSMNVRIPQHVLVSWVICELVQLPTPASLSLVGVADQHDVCRTCQVHLG